MSLDWYLPLLTVSSKVKAKSVSRETEGAVKVAVHRLRKRYGELVRAEIAKTVTDPSDVEVEMRHLVAALRGKSALEP